MTKFGKTLKEFETKDYQNRGGNYPTSDKPTDIVFYDDMKNKRIELTFSFKNTNEKTALNFVKSFLKNKNIVKRYKINAYQDGDYENDWVVVNTTFKR